MGNNDEKKLPGPEDWSAQPDGGESRLTAYLLGELDGAAADEVRGRLKRDATLRAEADELRATIDLLRGAAANEGALAVAGALHLRPEQRETLLASTAASAYDPSVAPLSAAQLAARRGATVVPMQGPMRYLAVAAVLIVGLAVVINIGLFAQRNGSMITAKLTGAMGYGVQSQVGISTEKLTGLKTHDSMLDTSDVSTRVSNETARSNRMAGGEEFTHEFLHVEQAKPVDSVRKAPAESAAAAPPVPALDFKDAGFFDGLRDADVDGDFDILAAKAEAKSSEMAVANNQLGAARRLDELRPANARTTTMVGEIGTREREQGLASDGASRQSADPFAAASYDPARGTTSNGDVYRLKDDAPSSGRVPAFSSASAAGAGQEKSSVVNIDGAVSPDQAEHPFYPSARGGQVMAQASAEMNWDWYGDGLGPDTDSSSAASLISEGTRLESQLGPGQSEARPVVSPPPASAAPSASPATAASAPLKDSTKLGFYAANSDAPKANSDSFRYENSEEGLVADENVSAVASPAEPEQLDIDKAKHREVAMVTSGEEDAAGLRVGRAAVTPAPALAPADEETTEDARSYFRQEEVRPAYRPADVLRRPDIETYDDMYFLDPGVFPIKDAQQDPLSTFGLDVDTGSFTVTRTYLDRGQLPPREAIRVEEFVNSVPTFYAEPTANQALAITLDGAQSPFQADRYLMRVGVQGRHVDRGDRPTARLTFVIDTSGSMDRENRIGLVKDALHLLLGQLVEGDRVGIVTFNSNPRVVLPPTGIEERATIDAAIDSLAPGGSTNLAGGLTLAYSEAARAFGETSVNRIILCSDGVANVGLTNPQAILADIGEAARRGIQLTTVGFGMGNYNDALMEQIANKGDGNYAYVDRIDEARRVFETELMGTLMTLARNAKIQVEWDPATVRSYRLIGYENRALRNRDFRDDAIDAGELGAGHTVTALYEVTLMPGVAERTTREVRPAATVRLRWLDPKTNAPSETEAGIGDVELRRAFQDAPATFRAAAATAEFAEMLRGSVAGGPERLEQLAAMLRGTLDGYDDPAPVGGIVDMIEASRALWAQRQKPMRR